MECAQVRRWLCCSHCWCYVRKPALDLSDVVRQRVSFGTVLEADWRHGRRVCLAASSGQAPTPHSGAPKARGLTAKARTERSSMLPRCASSSDTVREIKYQILHIRHLTLLKAAISWPD